MSLLRRWSAAVVVAAVALPLGAAAPTAALTAAPAAAFTAVPAAGGPRLTGAHPCPSAPTFTCSYLDVPLDRGGGTPGTVRLQAAVAGNAAAPRGALLVLTGGPGQPGESLVPRISARISYLLADYQLIMLDQRGTGISAIDCPRLQVEAGASDITPPSPAAVRECARLLGRTRNFYTTADTVADLDDLRAALGLRRWTVAGVSYGSFVAARYGLTHPGRATRIVLDSVVPQDGVHPLYEDSLHHARFVLRTACQEQRCGHDPAAELAAVVRRYNLGVDVFDLVVIGSIVDPKFTGDTYFPVLDLLHTAAGGDPAPLREAIAALHGGPAPPPAEYSSGLHVATICADMTDAPWGDSAAPLGGRTQALTRAVDKLSDSYVWPFEARTAGEQGVVHACRFWPPSRPNPDPPHRQLTMPVLILAGDRDLSTPVRWAREQAALTPGARLVVAPGAGHSLLGRNPVADEAVKRFLLCR
jgi:pimeloyl-ACP methyl ester carboxylesterase